jgi:hypothetical protein
MTTHIDTVGAPGRRDPIDETPWGLLCLDPDVEALFAEVDAILCAALVPHRWLPVPPATGSDLAGPPSAGRSRGAPCRPWGAPVHPVRAVPRSPPTGQRPATTSTNSHVKGR